MNNTSNIFNSPVETGLRSLTLLEAGYPNAYDLERISYYDYLLVHSGDIEGGPISIHPNTPHRAGEILIRRPVIEQGLSAMISRGLIEVIYSQSGITYLATELATPFLDSLQANYTKKMIATASWVVGAFDGQSNEIIRNLVNKNLNVWGGEFIDESLVKEGLFNE
ncbi:conserved hypothetical protein [Vibrio coralliirubri]|uniref:ABC-three component system middle component 2 n=1 Tax=Vibrio coralliirubri TaxID=1516159 RepID=UPI00063621A0|nr:ABC-three component system middle component 2 [Vibrio coralliirubri]CDT79402.1 conserved hypothetical protein [Vibrio coralliirubri]